MVVFRGVSHNYILFGMFKKDEESMVMGNGKERMLTTGGILLCRGVGMVDGESWAELAGFCCDG